MYGCFLSIPKPVIECTRGDVHVICLAAKTKGCGGKNNLLSQLSITHHHLVDYMWTSTRMQAPARNLDECFPSQNEVKFHLHCSTVPRGAKKSTG